MAEDKYTPKPEHKFTFGLWTVGNRGRDPFGDAVRPPLPPEDAARMLGEVGAWGVNFHDNDLVPIDAGASERDRIVRGFRAACESAGLVVPMATVNRFYEPVFRDGAFTANDARRPRPSAPQPSSHSSPLVQTVLEGRALSPPYATHKS
jgi:xylose isomerase